MIIYADCLVAEPEQLVLPNAGPSIHSLFHIDELFISFLTSSC